MIFTDENQNQNTPQNTINENPYDSTTSPAAASATSGVVYAGFIERLLAAIIDAVLVGFASGVIQALFGTTGETGSSIGSLISMVLGYAYFVYFISQRGQTLGKQALGIRVQNESTGQNLDVVSAILREVVGKFISALVLFLGYFWMLWDPKKQTWHDKIAKSVVVKVK